MIFCSQKCAQKMELIRVGSKVISKERLNSLISKILQLRASGSTQTEVAETLGVDRSFISHLEGLGEIREGKRIALVGFPISNKEEVERVAKEEGVDFTFLLSQEERERMGRELKGSDVFNEVLEILAKLTDFDVVIFLGSDWRISLMEKILGSRVFGISLGKSPLKKAVKVDVESLRNLISQASKKRKWGVWREKSRQRKSRFFKKRS